MNAEPVLSLSLKRNRFGSRLCCLILCVCSICILLRPAAAFDLVAPFKDPLKSSPDELQNGTVLPGDTVPVTCSVDRDFRAPLTLETAVDAALCNNPRIKSTWAAIKVQAGAVGEARAAYLPTVSGTVTGMHSSTRYVSSNSSSTTDGFTLYGAANWRLLDFGGRGANRMAADQLLTAALASHHATLQKTLANVVQAYFDAQTAKAAYGAKEISEAIALQTLETARRREEKGAGAVSDTLQAATAHSRARLEKSRAQGNYRKSLSLLVFAMGIPAHTTISLADDLYDTRSPDSRELEAWLEETRKQHPAITAAKAQLDAARNKVESARSEGLPTLDLTANYYQNGYPGQGLQPTQTQTYTVGLALTVPLFEGFSRTYKIRGATAQAEQRVAELQEAEQNILTEVVKAYADVTASLQNPQASDSLLQTAKAALASSQRKFDKGAADVLEMLNAQSALADAGQERIRCLSEWREAKLRLMANAGRLGRTAIVSGGTSK